MATDPHTTAVDPRWARILARDAAGDGQFWYSVLTTGVYCRPSCASRAANPANVTIHDTLAGARATGARPCRRCDPDGTAAARLAETIAAACRTIEAAEAMPDLATLAAAAGLSASHFHRRFRAARAARLPAALESAPSVTEAIHAAGFGSNGRFYAAVPTLLGMTPARYRAGGAGETLRFATGACSLGHILVASSASGIAAILIGDDPDALVRDVQDRFPAATLIGGDAEYEAVVAQVVGLVETPGVPVDLPLDVRGTAFQRRVWQALRAIPPGTTTSYREIAAAIGAPAAVRAVAGACAANAHAVAIPCHRVVRTDGGLSGYRWGIERKRALIARERA